MVRPPGAAVQGLTAAIVGRMDPPALIHIKAQSFHSC